VNCPEWLMTRRHVESAGVSLPIVGHVRNLSDCETEFGGGEFVFREGFGL